MPRVKNEPTTVQLILRVIGAEATTLLMRANTYGGRQFAVPKGELGRGGQAFAALAEVIGMDAAQRLCKHFGGDRLYIPNDGNNQRHVRNQQIVSAYSKGASMRTLVDDFGLTDRHIWSILKTTDITATFPSANERLDFPQD